MNFYCKILISDTAKFKTKNFFVSYFLHHIVTTIEEDLTPSIVTIGYDDPEDLFYIGIEIAYHLNKTHQSEHEISLFDTSQCNIEIIASAPSLFYLDEAMSIINFKFKTNFKISKFHQLLGYHVTFTAEHVTHEQLYELGFTYGNILLDKCSYHLPQEIMDFYKKLN